MKAMYIALIIIGIALVAYGTQGLIAKPSQSNSNAGAMGPEDSFPSIEHFESKSPAFSFDYPAFEGWRTEINGNEIRWNPPENSHTQFEVPPNVYWKEISLKVDADYWPSKPKNRQGVPYVEKGHIKELGASVIVFRLPKQGTAIEVVIPRSEEHSPFSGERIYTTIRDSFSEGSSRQQYSEAEQLAKQFVAQMQGQKLVVIAQSGKQYPFGWVFDAVGEQYNKTHNVNDMIVGIGPLVVNNDGTVLFLSSSVPPDVAIKQYAAQNKINR